MCIEEVSNAVSTFGGLEGAAWGIGWELGRCVTNTEWYQEMKFNMIYNPAEGEFDKNNRMISNCSELNGVIVVPSAA